MKIRLATPSDYIQISGIRNQVFPDFHETDEKLVESDRIREKKIKFCRWVAEVNNNIVGEAYYSHRVNLYHPNKFEIDIVVLPEYQQTGIGTALYNTVTNALEQFSPIQYTTHTRDNHPAGISFLTKLGFIETFRERVVQLDVQPFDLAEYEKLELELYQKGISFNCLNEIQNEKNYEYLLYELEWELVNDIPFLSEPLVKQSFEEWKKNSLNHPEIIHDAFFVAIKESEYIGYSYLWGGSDKLLVHNGMTGVIKKFRGDGIATILKIKGIKYAQENNYKTLWTSNSVTNEPVLTINEKLGYKTQYETIELTKIIQ